MAVTRARRKKPAKKALPRRKTTTTKAPRTTKGKLAAKRAAARARVGKARAALLGKARSLKAGLVAAGAAALETLRRAPQREANGASSEEERIEAAKYTPRHAPKRLFETERFIFPESYGVNRVRLLVKDPEWLFAHWDVDPAVMTSLRRDLGERALALSRLTLRLSDTVEGGSTVILLPKGARGFYIRADGAARSYQAELGLTLPSGEFKPLAASNTVGTPRVGPAPEPATARVRFQRSGGHAAEAARALAEVQANAARPGRPGPMADTRVVPDEGAAIPKGRKGTGRGGASDTYRR